MKKLLIIICLFIALISSAYAYDLSEYPDMFISGNNFNGVLVLGDSAPVNDVLAVSDIVSSLQYVSVQEGNETVINKINVGSTKLVSQISNPNLQNMILVGMLSRDSANGNSLIDQYYSGNPDGSLLKLIKNGNYYILIVTGDSSSAVKGAASILANYQDYDLSGMTYGSEKQTITPTCSDSDNGKDYYTKGTIDDVDSEGDQTITTDFCESTVTLIEGFCDNNDGKVVKYNCPNGCSNGACNEKVIDECSQNTDCDDNNSCTLDSCSGTPKICSNTESSIGCNYEGKCLPIGTRVENSYCDIDKEVKNQLLESSNCANNYECSTNVCVNNQCVSQNLIQKIITWFTKLFGG